ncbi:hypothetical protein GU927_009785 [Rhodobacteraceae bacterium HSP-20]|uniref:Calcium-binding protein n=2 Tax=Paragemmobacter amnigenus TaxID=2852097 RepID=A0ABS6J3U0_9RHOB|nr:hypothetical protein [Rhodobacter amnigenus]MBV4389359.1 hypothetical protein [Rhodobacter amnigenus]
MIYDGSGDDTLIGGAGDDELFMWNGTDVAFGGDGADSFYFGARGDAAFGGGGTDSFFLWPAIDGEVYIEGGDAADLTVIENTGATNSKVIFADFNPAGGDAIRVIDYDFTATQDGLTGAPLTAAIAGWRGGLTIDSFDDSYLVVTIGGSGIELHFPTISVTSPESVINAILAAITPVGNTERLGSDLANDTINGTAGYDALYGLAGNDSLSGNDGHDELYGGIGNDTLSGGNGWDFLDGGDGNDSLVGGAGGDTLVAGNGNDTMTGGSGSDLFVWDIRREGAKTITDFAPNIDTLRVVVGVDFDPDILDSAVRIVGGNTVVGDSFASLTVTGVGSLVQMGDLNVQIAVEGSEESESIVGFSNLSEEIRNNLLFGMGGDDALVGGDDGDDTIYGGDGNDTIDSNGGWWNELYGGDGDDTLYLSGDGLMEGGAGRDTFVFTRSEFGYAYGEVTDFDQRSDWIVIDNPDLTIDDLYFETSSDGTLIFWGDGEIWVAGKTPADLTPRIVFDVD